MTIALHPYAVQDAVCSLPQLLWQAAPGDSSPAVRDIRDRSLAHKERCRRLPPVSAAEADSLVNQFLASRGGVTRCPPAYAAPVR